MYLKSIEMHGFKSFANKIVFDFHNGITGIVGPNGSGKSNVADAVRWVLGEQSAKQLRGASMQDVIFSGTETRRPLSYAYVSITMDNSDHMLPIEFDEVTIQRRVYRSGESEYLLNGVACRLRDVTELFYDTGIGKEGYSIIGQGQIEKILSGKPEERRELFDEAVGIVKFKKRKTASLKKLQEERDNLVRVNDILKELERQIVPLERQSETARAYLKKKEEQKELDVNMYLLEVDRLNKSLTDIKENLSNAEKDFKENEDVLEKIKKEYASLEEQIGELDKRIEEIHEEQGDTTQNKSKLEQQIAILTEQIKAAEASEETVKERRVALLSEKEEKQKERENYLKEKESLSESLSEVQGRLEKAREYFNSLKTDISNLTTDIDNDNKEIMELLNKRADIKSREQHHKTLLEQTNIRKAELMKRLLERKTEEESIKDEVKRCEEAYDKTNKAYGDLRRSLEENEEKAREWKKKKQDASIERSENERNYQRLETKLESLKNIAERYEGYGNSVKKVMEQKDKNPGLIGVISDLIQVDKKYETAIETALGGNIQNIVTDDEATAKKMVTFLKENRFGRATFLPLTSVKPKNGVKDEDVLSEKGVLGIASDLVECDHRYDDVVKYLLGRVVVADHIDGALKIAKKYHYSMHIVTLEGEYLSPGGSLTGGSFKNNSNLLGRNREIDDIEKEMEKLSDLIEKNKARLDEIDTAYALVTDDINSINEEMQKTAIERNTAKISLDMAREKESEYDKSFETLNKEAGTIEGEINKIKTEDQSIQDEIKETDDREKALRDQIKEYQESLDEKNYMLETSASRNVSEIEQEEASIAPKVDFASENIARLDSELEKNEKALGDLEKQSVLSKEEVEKKTHDIEEIKLTIIEAEKAAAALSGELKESIEKKEALNDQYKGFFQKREDVSNRISALDKEIYRLTSQKEKSEGELSYQNNYMWEEYELTLHAAMELKTDMGIEYAEMKRMLSSVKDEIRKMGSVNVNAIEEYKEISERYNFLKGQHDDLIEAEQSLIQIIDELDTGMREQFAKGFADIQREFDKAFKELFGGGKGTLELVEGEDVLETGIKIIAQPPGKKLQNMMQLSGGEKSLTAIALLFAIQNLKPSPFCLLDEIEAALDDSNVDRFAKYLHKLTKNTQFIIITHRRGTMNSADRLYGITMQEKGVSTLVSVNLIENDLDE